MAKEQYEDQDYLRYLRIYNPEVMEEEDFQELILARKRPLEH